MKKYSIIVPLYNTEEYISKCIESVINQTYKNWELLIINDGSTDKSLEIARKYENLDKRIKIFTQVNKGVSFSRNIGIQKATGDYIIFLDSDDWYEKNLLDEISKYNDDFICFGFNKRFKNRNIEMVSSNIHFTNKITVKTLIHSNNYIEGYLPTKVYKRKIIEENKIDFDGKIHYCEDLMFVDNYIDKCESFKYIEKCLYNYRMRKSSASFTFFTQRNLSILDAYIFFINKYKDNNFLCCQNKYKLMLNYYKLKKVMTNKYADKIKNINIREREIFKNINLSKKEKINYIIIKYNYKLYLILKKYKDYRLKLYE